MGASLKNFSVSGRKLLTLERSASSVMNSAFSIAEKNLFLFSSVLIVSLLNFGTFCAYEYWHLHAK